MTRRKPHNTKARIERYCRSMLRLHAVAVLNSEAAELQALIDYKRARVVATSDKQSLIHAVCEIPHQWTLYLAYMCQGQTGERYMKSAEVVPQGVYKAQQLGDVIEPLARELLEQCNPLHRPRLGWIAIPDSVSLSEDRAARIFETFGAWPSEADEAQG